MLILMWDHSDPQYSDRAEPGVQAEHQTILL